MPSNSKQLDTILQKKEDKDGYKAPDLHAMTKNSKHDWYEITEDNRFIILGRGDAEPNFIGAKKPEEQERGKQILAAASKHFWMGNYNVVAPGLHLYTTVNGSNQTERIGYIAEWYTGSEYPKPKAGWKPLMRVVVRPGDEENGIEPIYRYEIGEFDTREWAEKATNYHDAIEFWDAGGRLKINTAFKKGWVAYFIQQCWEASDDKLAKKEALQKIRDVAEHQYVSGELFERQQEYAFDTGRNVSFRVRREIVNPAEVTLKVYGDKSMPLNELPIGAHQLYKNGRFVCWDSWTGYNADRWKKNASIYEIKVTPVS